MKTNMVSKKGHHTTVFLETADITTLSLDNWEIIRTFVHSGVGVHLSEECSRNMMNFDPCIEDGENWDEVVMSMDVNGFHMMTKIRRNSEYFFQYEDYPSYKLMRFGIWARVEINPQ